MQKKQPVIKHHGSTSLFRHKTHSMVEGEYKVINDLYNRIKTDPRHDQTRLISMGPIQSKAFPSWHMGARKIVGNELDFKTSISTEDKEIFKSLLTGKQEDGPRALGLLKKFF